MKLFDKNYSLSLKTKKLPKKSFGSIIIKNVEITMNHNQALGTAGAIMKDFNTVQRYLWEDDDYSEHGGGYLYTSSDGQYVEYEDYKELLKQYNELSYRLESLEK